MLLKRVQMYKIFHENRALIFPDIEEEKIQPFATDEKCDSYDAQLLCDFFSEWLDDTEQTDTIIQQVEAHDVAQALQHTFKMAPAAGGIVTEGGRCLVIDRKGIADLPKGHIENGESPQEAAVREVEEETGMGALSIMRELPPSWHVYQRNGVWELKKTYWYEMQSSQSQATPRPQEEEGITAARWVDQSGIDAFLGQTFRSIREILGEEMRHVVMK